LSSIILKKMPPVGGDLFIGGGYGDDVDVGVCAHDDNDEHDPVSQVAFDPQPTEREYEDIDSIYIAECDQHTSVLESRLRWHDNILGTKPMPLHKLVYELDCESVALVCEHMPYIPTRKHQIVLL
jgi:hypothetical protein